MLTIQDFLAARHNLQQVIHCTPLDYSKTFSSLSHNEIYLKLENLQKTGSFKIRGAFHKIASLSDEEKKRGVIAASAGNHAQGVAFGAAHAGIPCIIVMPESAPLTKVEATSDYGAQVILYGKNYDEAYAKALEIQRERGMTFVHAFNDRAVMAGQGTIALEILEQLPDCDVIVTPIGGGGLVAGVAMAAKLMKPDIMIVGVEASGAACMKESLDNKQIVTLEQAVTIADGICVRTPGDLTFQVTRDFVDHIITVEEEEIARAMLMALERNKMVVEGAGATGLAAVIYDKLPVKGKKICVLLSGGNVDVNFLSRIIERGLVESGRYLRINTTVPDKPGVLQDILKIFGDERANIIGIQHHRMGSRVMLGQAEIEVDIETRDHAHQERILGRLQDAGFSVVTR
ncbi:threonine ammonia-lyase [Tumebacillus permanentifrigoris]|uniref:L-threonine dehydratase catabolic TdcB n=1 Tax=Tumebacillus permanentifrigoris TaxID=378543 RepID=A0A316DCL1_9BACL|nr:threonine ammonia-lyase [Tumebacillus permanentifrigoris]PWK15897.1 threonine dehydratase [Tumebacillus permanentifrigoris]